ncbi:MAG: CHAT domain-containing protein [Rubrivivax sp.]
MCGSCPLPAMRASTRCRRVLRRSHRSWSACVPPPSSRRRGHCRRSISPPQRGCAPCCWSRCVRRSTRCGTSSWRPAAHWGACPSHCCRPSRRLARHPRRLQCRTHGLSARWPLASGRARAHGRRWSRWWRSARARSPFLGWGDPAFAGDASAASAVGRSLDFRRSAIASIDYHAIPPLPDTRDELLAIAETLRADPQRDLLLGPRATRSSVVTASRSGELAERRVVAAFATHGLMAGDLPGLDQPALALAATGEEATDPLAPLLRLDDVLQLRLNADWVVLSACNTAAADGRAEEALSGLARGFFFAGARSLLVTHWAVETESARRLTTGTFAYHAAHPEAGKAESLRRAMLDLMNDPRYRHPAYWAPFALVGDGRR